ncbi:MAG: portal protein, partial [Planctomycetota bacterium]
REGRPALTINLILPIINLLSGIQRQGRQDVSVVARKGGLKPLAAVFTQVLRHCLDITDADYEIADAFLDGIVGSKGWLEPGIDETGTPAGGVEWTNCSRTVR